MRRRSIFEPPLLVVVIALALLIVLTGRSLRASNQELHGFRYQSCDGATCFEVRAPKAWLTQMPSKTKGPSPKAIHAGFTTGESTVLTLLDAKGAEKTRFTGTSATLHPELGLLSLDAPDGSTVLLTLETGKVQILSAGVQK